MKIKLALSVLLSGFLALNAVAGFEQFNDPAGGVNVFDLGYNYIFTISPFGVPDLQSVTSDNRTFELLPNVNLYEDNPADPFWRNNGGAGPDGNTVIEANTLFEMPAITADIDGVVFGFNVDAYDLDVRYQVTGFIKVLDSVGGSYATLASASQVLTQLGPVELQLPITGAHVGQLLQVGWTLTGINANPADDWGSALLTATNLYASSTDSGAPEPNPMGFAVEPYAASSTSITMTASNAVDLIYGVEYLFTNTTTSMSSEWQSSPTWLDEGPPAGPATTNTVDKITDPTFSNIDANWSGFGAGGGQTPSTFVSVAGGVATVTPGSDAEWDFYQEFTDVLNAGQQYEFSIVSDNSTLVGASSVVAFVKAFGPGYVWMGGEFQTVPLSLDGSPTTLTLTAQPGTSIYQIGVFVVGATSGSLDVSSPSLLTDEVTPGASAGLTPDAEYTYQVKARDLSPALNETAWSAPVSAFATVSDFAAPTPDPMVFAVAPAATSDSSVIMTATTATDDTFGVEYLFTNTVTSASSGWQSSPTWIDSGDLVISNADFEAGLNGWNSDNNVGWGDPSGTISTNISGNTSALAFVNGSEDNANGGYAVFDQAVTNIASLGFKGGDEVTISADIRALAGLNGGGALLKMESWGGGVFISDSGDIFLTVTESWANYGASYTVAAGADEVRVVFGTSTGWGGPNAEDSYYLFDNMAVTKSSALSPGTQYSYRVKARDTSPNNNETAWSLAESATTTGQAPQLPFDVQLGTITPGNTVFDWQGTAGYTYSVQYSTNLVTGTWTADPSPGAAGIYSDGGAISATSTVNEASVFYRIISQ